MLVVFLLHFLALLFQALWFAIVGRALLSWFPIRPGSPFYQLVLILHQVTEPILAPIRRVLPRFGMFDLSPLVALLLLDFLHRSLTTSVLALGAAAG